MPPSVDVCDFIAGWIGGAAGVVSSHPLDTVKVRLQTLNIYKGTTDCVIKTLQNEGARGFLKGMSFPLASIAAYNAVVFGVYSNVTRSISEYRYNDAKRAPSYMDITVASMITGGISVIVGAPVDLVKIRLQAQTGQSESERNRPTIRKTSKPGLLTPRHRPLLSWSTTVTMTAKGNEPYRGVVDCLVRIYKDGGLKSFYGGGATAMLLRDIPGYAMYFLPYAILCNLLKNNTTGEMSALGYIMAGGLAGVISWGTAHPMDTVKSRMQLAGGRNAGVLSCAISMYRNEGPQVFFRGLGANALRGFPQSAALFLGYEMSMKAMRT